MHLPFLMQREVKQAEVIALCWRSTLTLVLRKAIGHFAMIALRICAFINIYGVKCAILAAFQHVAAYADVPKKNSCIRLGRTDNAEMRG